MPTQVRRNGAWVTATRIQLRVGGVWVDVTSHLRKAGAWSPPVTAPSTGSENFPDLFVDQF